MKRLLLLLAFCLLLPSAAEAQNAPVMTVFASADRATGTYTTGKIQVPGYAKGAYVEVLKTAGSGTCTIHLMQFAIADTFSIASTTTDFCIYPSARIASGFTGANCSALVETMLPSQIEFDLVVATANATCSAAIAFGQ